MFLAQFALLYSVCALIGLALVWGAHRLMPRLLPFTVVVAYCVLVVALLLAIIVAAASTVTPVDAADDAGYPCSYFGETFCIPTDDSIRVVQAPGVDWNLTLVAQRQSDDGRETIRIYEGQAPSLSSFSETGRFSYAGMTWQVYRKTGLIEGAWNVVFKRQTNPGGVNIIFSADFPSSGAKPALAILESARVCDAKPNYRKCDQPFPIEQLKRLIQ